VMSLHVLWALFIEIHQIKKAGMEYISGFGWNIIDFLIVILPIIYIILNLNESDPHGIRPLTSIIALVFWTKFFYFGRLVSALAFNIRIIFETIYDFLWFLFILILSISGFTHVYYVLAHNTTGDQHFTGDNIF
jgi:hypothetical protein